LTPHCAPPGSRNANKVPHEGFNLKTAVDGHNKAQNEKGGVEKVVINPVRVSACAKSSFLCAFCAFSWLTAFSEFNQGLRGWHGWEEIESVQSVKPVVEILRSWRLLPAIFRAGFRNLANDNSPVGD